MCDKVIRMGTIIVAVLVALISVFPMSNAVDMMVVMRFFQAMLPVLAVGALLKFLMK